MILLALLKCADNETGTAAPYADELLRMTGLKRSSFYEQRKVLVLLGYIDSRERVKSGGQTTTEYVLHFGRHSRPEQTDRALSATAQEKTHGKHDRSQGAGLFATAIKPPARLSKQRPPPNTRPEIATSTTSTTVHPMDTSPLILSQGSPEREIARAKWSVVVQQYLQIRKDKYGAAGTAGIVPQEYRDEILTAVDHVAEEIGVTFEEAAAVLIRAWMQHFPGTKDALVKKNHALWYLGKDAGDAAVYACKALRMAAKQAAAEAAKATAKPRVEAAPVYDAGLNAGAARNLVAMLEGPSKR